MRRALLLFLALGIVLVVLGAGFALVRPKRPQIDALLGRSKADPMTNMPTASAQPPASSASTPRGDVTIDPRRQQLIGVRTVEAKKTSLATSIRAVGSVKSAETSLADVNVKLDGWIRDLFVDYTGQPVTRGQPLFTLYSPICSRHQTNTC